jgi:plastocyanin
MRLHIRTIAIAAFVATACGGGGDGGTNPPPTQKLGSITAGPATINLDAGETGTVTVQARDETGAVISGASGFSFTPVNAAIAEVSSSGNILAIEEGSTVVNVSLTRNGVTKTASVTVNVNGHLPNAKTITAGQNLVFQPNRVAIAVGGTVTFNAGAVAHNVTFEAGVFPPSFNIPTGSNWIFDRTFATAGNFNFTCTIHGMQGVVIVR